MSDHFHGLLIDFDLHREEYEEYCVKQARMAAHRSFDLFWKFGHMTRNEAYNWLAKVMDKPRHRAHMYQFTEDECNKVIEEANKYWKEVE